MFNLKELKQKIEKTDDIVECPVKGCKVQVKRMNNRDQKKLHSYIGIEKDKMKEFEKYFCKVHKIYISPTTFIYKYLKDNLFWYGEDDKALLDEIFKVKRVKYQLFHHNSEDAVSWNVFRFLEKNNLVSDFLTDVIGFAVKKPEVIYWSYSQSQKDVWDELTKARAEFGENMQRSSEPDLIVKSDTTLFFVETKLTTPNKVDFNRNHTEEEKKERISRYSRGDHFLRQSIENIIDAGYYQLMRFWMIGSCIAKNKDLDFYLLNLIRKDDDNDIESKFGEYLELNEKRIFKRISWGAIYKYISNTTLSGGDKNKMLRYFRNKTIYDTNGELQRAFPTL